MARVGLFKVSFAPFFLSTSKMDPWDDWTLAPETEDRLRVILSKFEPSKSDEDSNIWQELFNFGSPVIPDNSFSKMEVDISENLKEAEIFNLIKESLEANATLPETKLCGLSFNSLGKILSMVKDSLNEMEFSAFCKFIISWTNCALIEESLRLIILPKLKEKPEASACVIFSIKELLLTKPDETVHQVLVPLLPDETFSDVELLKELLPALKPEHKDYLIMAVCKKDNLKENDWLVLQVLLQDLSQNSICSISNCILKYSNEFTKSQVFGRFLVSFCKNLEQITNKNLLVEAIENHQTLLKKQALKYLNQVEEI